LSNGITYSCAIKSINSAGSVSSASVNGTPTSVLTRRTLTLAVVGDTTLLYTFVPVPGETYTASCVVAANSTAAGTVTVGDGNFIVLGLTNGTTYSCTVKSTNSAGSVSSLAVSGTPIAVPTARTLTLQSVGDKTLGYTFTAITGETYAASCIDVSTSASAGTATVGNGTVSVTGLSNGTTYGCKIKSTNSAGSATSASVSGTPNVLPTARTLTLESVGNTTLSFTFTPVSGEKYAASCNLASITTPFGIATVSSGTVSVTGLSNDVAYSCTITSTNSAGSVTSASVNGTPKQFTVPGKPTNVTLNGTECYLKLSWELPTSDGGSALQYFSATMVWSIGGKRVTTTTQSTTGGAASSIEWPNIGGTGAGDVTIELLAHNSVGDGPIVTTAPYDCFDPFPSVPK
jgi:titin